MRLTPDTNLLVRAIVEDDEHQSRLAQRSLESADAIALTLSSLCELAWVLTRAYKYPAARVAAVMRVLLGSANVAVNVAAVEAGLAVLERDGDFADGVIAHEGRLLGGDVFVSFDKRAVKLLEGLGVPAFLLT